MAMTPTTASTASASNTGQTYRGPFAIMTVLFFMWGFMTVFNDILIPKFKEAFTLDYYHAMFVQLAFFGAYFIGSLVYFIISAPPAIQSQKSATNGVIIGLLISAAGSALFWPAATKISYPLFLAGLFVVGLGFAMLQIAANPYVTILGPERTASSHLNLAQAFNSVGTTIGPLIGGYLIFQYFAKTGVHGAESVKVPYLIFCIIFVFLAAVFFCHPPAARRRRKSGGRSWRVEISARPARRAGDFHVCRRRGFHRQRDHQFARPVQRCFHERDDASKYVSLFWGGMLIAAPFGMVQISPDTDITNWDTDSGYEYTDPTILGFSLTHLSGTGCPDLGDFLFMPQVGKPEFISGAKDHPEEGYQSAFSHADESATAGYYKVKLQKSGVTAELTADERAGILRFTFPASDEASILLDLNHVINGGRWRVAESRVRIEDNSTITGFHLVNGWAKERYLYFAARFSRPFDEAQIISAGKPVIYTTYRFRSRNEAAGTNLQFFAKFKTHADEVIQVKVAVSAVSAANAIENLDAEIPGWNFEKVREATRSKWERELSRIQIEGTPEQKATFYTSLYHAFLTPNLYQDVNGEYRGFDQNIHQSKKFTEYTVFSL